MKLHYILPVILSIGCGSKSLPEQTSKTASTLSLPLVGSNLIYDCRAASGPNAFCKFREVELVGPQPYESTVTINHTFICAGHPVNLGFFGATNEYSVPYNSGTNYTTVTGFGPISTKNFNVPRFDSARFSRDCRFIVNSIDVVPSEGTKSGWRSRKAELVTQISDAKSARDLSSELNELKGAFDVIVALNENMSQDLSRNIELRSKLNMIRTCAGSAEGNCNLLKKIMFSRSTEFSPAQKNAVLALEIFVASLPSLSACQAGDAACAPMILEQSLSPEDLQILSDLKAKGHDVSVARERYEYFVQRTLSLQRDLDQLVATAGTSI